MDLLRLPEIFVDYLDFLLDFAVGPVAALQPHAAAARLDDTLFLFLLAGATTAYFMLLAAHKSGLRPQRDMVKENYGPLVAALLASDLDSKSVPLVAVFVLFPGAILFHVSSHLGGLLVGLLVDADLLLSGTVRDTINAAFAFGAFFLPIWALTIIVMTWRARRAGSEGAGRWSGWLSGELGVLLISAYFPAALAGTHSGATFGRAFLAFVLGLGGWVVIAAALLQVANNLLRLVVAVLRSICRAGSRVWARVRRL